MKKQTLLFIIFLIMGNMMILAQNCNVNAGANAVICGTSTNLSGSPGGNSSGNPLWTLVSKPSGAPDPIIATPSGYNTNVTGMTYPGNYVFQIAQNCTTGTATSQVTITAPGDVSTFTAGADVTNVSAITGTTTLAGVIPTGYTASWTYYNISDGATTNATMANTSTATPTLSLIKKADHNIDPAYRAVLRITSINNPNCWYEDEAIVRFIPNPQIITNSSYSGCFPPQSFSYIDLSSNSPRFVTNNPNTSGNPAYGTTVTINAISQPAGANISFATLENQRMYFNGADISGTYVFTITVSNANGTYTTLQITFTNNGVPPNRISFLDTAYPEQLTYRTSTDAGSVYCNMAGQTTPITFYFKINPADPATITTTANNTGTTPPGGNPSLVLNGAGTMNRNITVTPPAGGWQIGTYKVGITVGSGVCTIVQPFYIHISDGNRPNMTVPNTTVCYPGSGVVTATIPLPSVYVGVINSSYLQDFTGKYQFTLVSKPSGAANPVYGTPTLTSTSTTISNLDKEGEYVFKIKAVPSGDPQFLDKEYSCSGTSLEGTFSIFVSAQVGSNAGSVQNVVGTATTFNGNNPGAASTGTWTLVSKPAGAQDPVIVTPSAYNTNVTGFTNSGTYTFRWTVTTGTCTSASDLTVNVSTPSPGGVAAPDFWVKSDDVGTIATAWKDNSSSANNIPNIGGVALSAADRSHNFYPYTTGYSSTKYFHNGVSVMNPTNASLPNTNTSIFSAVRPTTLAAGRIIGIDDDNSASEPGISITAAGLPHEYEFFNTTTSSNFSTPFNIGQSNIFSALQNNTVANGGTSAVSGGERRLGLNGAYQVFSGFGTGNQFQILGRLLRIGYSTWDVNGAFPGDIMEIVWYNRTLTANEQSRVSTYLAIKNGVTASEDYLTSINNTVWSIATNTGYNNNIFGLARDNNSALHQKQAAGTATGQKLVIGYGTTLFDSNTANTNSLTDGQFLLIGDNGLKQNLTIPFSYTAGSNGIVNYRFESIWKVQNTNSIGTVTVAWPKSVKNLYLVQSPDATFDGTDIFTPMATEVIVNGVIYNTVNVTLTDGQFFTFAGFGNAPGGVASGLSYWYRADKNAVNTGTGTDVTGWTDMWNDTTVAQIGTNALPKYVLGTSNYFNFNPGINFTTATQAIGNISVSSLSSLNYDIFTLTKEGMAGARFLNLGRDNTTMNGTNWDSPAFYADGTVARRTNTGALVYLTNPGAVAYSTTTPSIMYNTFTDTTVSKGLNGAANGTTGSNTAIGLVNGGHIFGANNIAPLGGDDGGFTGNIGETIIYGAGTLSNTERRKVDSYLAIKYGITMGRVNTDHYLDANGNQVWNGGTNTAFNNNIFGVAREDIGLFEQKVSKSVNTGTILTVATTNDFVNPNQNTARTGFANDKTYFLLGDNNITTTTLSSITINGYTGGSRIPRVWLTQRTNTSSTMYFGADLSSYGAGFGSGDHVKMIIADDAAFTTNVVYVNGTYDAATGKWVHSYNFDSENAKRYITYAVVDEVACTTGCNDNTYLNASDPNTIEYDNIIASEMSTIIKQKDGSFYIWGPYTSPNVSSSNTNVVLNLLTPTKIDPTTSLPTAGSTGAGFNYTGTPLKAALQGGNTSGGISYLLTTDGLYIWGSANMYSGMANTYRTPNSNTFGKLTVNNKADGLPPGVSPTNVKMMSGNQTTLTIVTCSGAVWTYSQSGAAYTYGDGMVVSTANDSKWHRVMTSATQTLDNVVAARGILGTKFVLTSDGKLYTWGNNTFHNDNTSGAISNYATEISVPAGVTPKMIGMTEGVNEGESSYYLLATNGKLYAMGYNNQKQLGLGDTVTRLNWTEVTATDGAQSLGGNIAWISPAENANNYPSINVLTTDGKQWGWGYSLRGQLGSVNTTGLNPTYMPGNGTAANELSLSDKVIAVEDGGYHAINFKENSTKYGFIGWNSYGTKGDGSSPVGGNDLKYTYISPLDICAKAVSSFCYKPGIIAGTALDTKVGITALGRAGAGTIDNWPMVRKGGWLALEAKTKGFVPNRVKFNASNQPVAADGVTPVITTPVEGMMVYDTTNKCMKIYTLKEGDSSMAWHCITTQACPD